MRQSDTIQSRTECSIEALQQRCLEQEMLNLFGLPVKNFLCKIISDEAMISLKLRNSLSRAMMITQIERRQLESCDPAFGAHHQFANLAIFWSSLQKRCEELRGLCERETEIALLHLQ